MNNIQSLHRAFAIVSIISRDPTVARPGAIAEVAGLPKTTVLRMLNTLEEIGAVVRDPKAPHYQIGTLIRDLAHPNPTRQQLIEVARPFMHQLANQTGETVYLCVESGDQVQYIDQIDAQHHILLRNWVGISFPIHTTASGKLFLAFWNDEKVETYLKRPLQKYTDQTVIDPAKIRQYIAKIRTTRIAWTHGQTENELIGVAAPIWTAIGSIVGAISVGGPAFRFPQAGQEETVATQVSEAATQISKSLQISQMAQV